MATGVINKALNWLGCYRYSSDYTEFFTPNTNYVTMSDGQMIERAGIVNMALHFKLANSLSVPVDGNCSDVIVGTVASKYRPKVITGWMSRGGGYQIFGTIEPAGYVTILGVGSHGVTYSIGTSANLYITATYVLPYGTASSL